jgi:Protein of unknown function (DUF3108)
MLAAWCGCATTGWTAAAAPSPFTAVYALKWHGITAGRSTLTLMQTDPGTYRYQSVNRARGLFRLAFPDAITETSRFTIADGHVRPLSYQEVNGPGKTGRDVHIEFDWQDGRARGIQHGKPVNQPLAPGTQDPLSVQIELMRDLAAGASPTRFLLFDQDVAKPFRYTRERTVHLDTAIGSFDTVVYRSDRPGSDRVLRLWLAPSLGYLPVKAERERKGHTEFELEILSLEH